MLSVLRSRPLQTALHSSRRALPAMISQRSFASQYHPRGTTKPLLLAAVLGTVAAHPTESCMAELWTSLSSLPVSDPMTPILVLSLLQALMGGTDNIVHHELLLRLPWTSTAQREQLLHSVRQVLYCIVFLSLAGVTPTGAYAYGLLGILGIETGLTLADFVEEDRSRKLPWTERIAHTLLTVNYGAILALWVPLILSWAALPTGFTIANYGLFSFLNVGSTKVSWAALPTGFTIANYGLFSFLNVGVAAGVFVWGIRDFLASRRIARFNKLEKENPFTLNLTQPRQKILVTGGTGFIGTKLCNALLKEGHEVTLLARDRSKAAKLFGESGGKLTLISEFEDLNSENSFFDVVVNLAGEPIGTGRWTDAKKKRIFASRVELTKKLIAFMKKMKTPPKILVSGSAIGFYGVNNENSEHMFSENSAPLPEGGMSHKLCKEWEDTALEARQLGARVVLLRTGIVLGREGGALSQMLIPFELGVGGVMGSGKQWMPWVHVEDVLRIIATGINDPSLEGPINTTAPTPVTNSEFTKGMGKAMRRPTIFPLPAFVLNIIFGKELSNELLLTGTRVVPKKLEEHGFNFRFPDLESALNNLIRGEKAKE